MNDTLQPIVLWGQGGPNPPKVAILLSELDLPHTIIPLPFADVKKPEYLALNPNGRLPTIQDPNTGITIWESGAIVEYLIEKYDTDHKLSFTQGSPEYYHAKQWLFFQTTGQGPYYGQLAWFRKFSTEKVQYAIDRYAKEADRITGVLNGWLEQQEQKYGQEGDGPWLVGNKFSYADLSFVPWQTAIKQVVEKSDYDLTKFPYANAWYEKMAAREKFKKVLDQSKKGH